MTPEELKNYVKELTDIRRILDGFIQVASNTGHLYKAESGEASVVRQMEKVKLLQGQIGEAYSSFVDGIERIKDNPDLYS